MVVQAALSDGVSFDPFARDEDGLGAPEVDVGRGEIVEALVVSAMVVIARRKPRSGLRGLPGRSSFRGECGSWASGARAQF